MKAAKAKVGVLITILAVAMLFSGFAVAQKDANAKQVFLVKSHNADLKSKLGVRHNFEAGFTTKLNPHQVSALQRRGVVVEEVPKYHLLAPPGACSPWPECKDKGGGGDDDGGSTTREGTPSDQTPWGIEKVYGNSTISSTSGGSNVDVAVLDTGVDKSHPDLKRRVADCKDFTKGPAPKNGCEDKVGHGTHVSGTVAADSGEDGKGIFGVAPESKIFAYKVCKDNGCWTDDIAAAIDYAGDHGAEIVSMSLGGDSQSSLIKEAISRNSHMLFVAAAGNDGPDKGSIDYPGANVEVMAAAAIDINGGVPEWSSRGVNDGDFEMEEKEVEVGAPGVDVESTCTGDLDGSTSDKDGKVNGYCIISGTSMSTPHVSGLAAKFWSSGVADANGDGTTTAAEVRGYVQEKAKKHDLHTEGDDIATGFGLPTVG